jgi:hypothetical protein
MKYNNLVFYYKNKIYSFKIYNKKYINTSLFLVYKINKNIMLDSTSIVLEVPFEKFSKLYQLNANIEECEDYTKEGIEYFQQTFIFNKCKIILRYDKKHIMKEIFINFLIIISLKKNKN